MKHLTAVIIPARKASTRIPDKLLKEVNGKTVLETTYNLAAQAQSPYVVGIATDSTEEMYNLATSFCPVVIKTPDDIQCGTDRIAVASTNSEFRLTNTIINVQGDEIHFEPSLIDEIAEVLSSDDSIDMVIAYKKTTEARPGSTFKLLVSDGILTGFERATQDDVGKEVLEHIGIVGFKKEYLWIFGDLAPTDNFRRTNNEYYKALDNGARITLLEHTGSSHSLNVPEDLEIYQDKRP